MNIAKEFLENKKSNLLVEDQQATLVDLAPYRVKNIENFYFRDHPENLNPYTPRYKKYWGDFAVKCVEGAWVNDEGTWYWMPPVAVLLCNYLIIEDEKKNPIKAHFRDLERIQSRYYACCDGFSGFRGDDRYTCNHLVKKHKEGTLEQVQLKKITKDCYISGTDQFKEYVDPWTYLMRTYLIDDVRKKPLGVALYDNPIQNRMVMGGRGSGKSVVAFVADFMHEWFFCGVRFKEDLHKTQKTQLFGMASGDSGAIDRSLGLIGNVMTRLPGSYNFPTNNGEEDIPRYMGPFYKNYSQSFATGKTATHIEKDAGGRVIKRGVSAQMRVITPDKTKIFAGDRFSRIYIEEAGFVPQLMDIHTNQHDTLEIFGNRIGSAVYLGCVCKGSQVWDRNGHLIPIEDVTYESGIVGFDEELARSVPQNISYLNPPNKKECVYIETDSGRSIRCSVDHPIMIRERHTDKKRHLKKKAIWAEAGGIFTDVAIAVVDKCEIWGDNTLFDPWLVGMLIGDGTYGAGQMARLVSADDDTWNYVEDNYTLVYTHNEPTKDGRRLRKARLHKVAPKLADIGIGGQVSVHKKLPEIIYSCDKNTVCELLAGYYDADGCISISKNNYTTIKLTSISLHLIQGAQALLGKMGIHGKIRKEKIPPKGKHTPYSLYIKDKRSIIEFHRNIPLKVGYKRDNLNRMVEIAKRVSDKYIFSKYKGLRWEKVVRVVNIGWQDVYNLAASDTHTYTVNGFHTHNTSGELKSFRIVNEMFNSPETYDIQPIPNYWSGSGKSIGLFLPAYYTKRDYADENQNVDIEEAFKFILADRKKYRETASSMAYDKKVMFHPIEPKEMMRPSGESVLPKQEAQEALNRLESFDIFQKRATVGKLFYDKKATRGVRFKPDLANELTPITSFSTAGLPNTLGAFIQYETPLTNPPKDLYWVIYDPAAQSGEGSSLHSVLVYKYSFSGNDQSLEDTIVAEWIGRLPTLEENYNMVTLIANYFDAKIFPETNITGFLEWANRTKKGHLLQPENMSLKREINPRAKNTHWRKGFRMDGRTKGWALNKLRDWLLEVKEYNDDGIPTKRIIDTIYSPRILEEIINFDLDGNFDHVSSLLGLMVLQNALEHIAKPVVKDEWSEDEYFYTAQENIEYVTPYVRRARASVLNY